MSPRDLRTILDCWAAWIESGRPVPFNAWPPSSILARWNEEHAPSYRSRPLWQGKMRSFWLADVDRRLRELPEQRQLILLGMHLPGRGTDATIAQELGVTLPQVRYAREAAHKALEGL